MQKKMFKVISPVDRRDGGKFWMRCGSAFVNKDESINIYLDALPLAGMGKGDGVTLQLRELTEEDLRERADKKSTYASRGAVDPNGLPSLLGAQRGGGGGAGAGDGPDVIPF